MAHDAQWGVVAFANAVTVPFPIAFSVAPISVIANERAAFGWSASHISVYGTDGRTKYNFALLGRAMANGGALDYVNTITASWFAVGV